MEVTFIKTDPSFESLEKWCKWRAHSKNNFSVIHQFWKQEYGLQLKYSFPTVGTFASCFGLALMGYNFWRYHLKLHRSYAKSNFTSLKTCSANSCFWSALNLALWPSRTAPVMSAFMRSQNIDCNFVSSS